jgi:hypothetical protein
MRVPRRFRATVEVVAAPAVDGHATSAPVLEAQVRACVRRSRRTRVGPSDKPPSALMHRRPSVVVGPTGRTCNAAPVAVDYAPTGGSAVSSRPATKEWSLALNQPPPLSRPVYIPNHLVWAILTTLFCCLPLGVVSIVYASQVDGRRAAGDLPGAYSASRKAGWWAVASAVALPVLLLLWFGLFGGLAVLGALSDQ